MVGSIALLLMAAALVISACSGDSGELAGPTVDPVNILTSGAAEPSARQLEMIADGRVDFQEYEQAYLAFVQCVTDAGITIREGPRLDVHGQNYRTSFAMGSTPAEAQASNRLMAECQDRHLNSVLVLWSAANRPSEELLQEANQALRDCLAEREIEMPLHLTGDHFGALLSAAASGEPGGIPEGLSLDDISPLLAEHPDAGSVFFEFLTCRERVGEQYPVGW